MVSAQRARREVRYEHTKYGRKNWAPEERDFEPARKAVKLTKRAFILYSAVMAVLVSVVVLTAYMSQIRYDVNAVAKENASIQANIDMMELELEKDRSINRLEERATTELGMKYPDPSEVVFLEPSVNEQDGVSVAKNEYQ